MTKSEENPGATGGTESAKDAKKEDDTSLFDKVSLKVLGAISPEVAETLKKLQKHGAFTLDEANVPAYLKYESDTKSLRNVLRGLLKSKLEGEDIESLTNITENDLKNLIDELTAPQNNTLPKSYVTSPRLFGNNELDEKELKLLRDYKTDNKHSEDVENALVFLKNFHEKRSSKFTEQALKDSLTIVAPKECTQFINNLRRQGANLAEIYENLNFSYGTSQTKEEVLSKLHDITDSKEDPMKILDKIHDIFNTTAGSVSSLNDICVNESRRYIRSHCGPHIVASIDSFFLTSPSQNFRDYCRIVKTHFSGAIKNAFKTKNHHIEDELHKLELKNQINHISGVIDELKKESNSMHNIIQATGATQQQNPSPSQGSRTCWNCNSKGHFARNCTKPRNNASNNSQRQGGQNNKNLYTNQNCAVHSSSSHTNGQCRSQRGPCQHASNHANHAQGDCRRNVNGGGQSGGQFQGQPLQGGVAQQPQQHYQHPPAQAQNNVSITDLQNQVKVLQEIMRDLK